MREKLQFHDETNICFAFERIVKLKKSNMLKSFHDFDFIVRFDTVLFFVYLNEFSSEKMFSRFFTAFFDFTKFSSEQRRTRINKNKSKMILNYLPRNSKSSYSSVTDLFFLTVTTRGENGGSISTERKKTKNETISLVLKFEFQTIFEYNFFGRMMSVLLKSIGSKNAGENQFKCEHE